MNTPRFVVIVDAPGADEPYTILDTHADRRDIERYCIDTAATEEEANDLAQDYEAAPHTA